MLKNAYRCLKTLLEMIYGLGKERYKGKKEKNIEVVPSLFRSNTLKKEDLNRQEKKC